MSLKRIPLSVSQLCEQLEIDPATFHSIENGRWERDGHGGQRWHTELQIVIEEPDADERHLSPTDHR